MEEEFITHIQILISKYNSVQDVADYLRVSRPTVERWAQGKICHTE